MAASSRLILSLGALLAGCAPYPVYVSQAPIPLAAARAQLTECALIRQEIARQERIAETSGIMATLLVEGAVRLNASNVISGLESRAAMEGCPIAH